MGPKVLVIDISFTLTNVYLYNLKLDLCFSSTTTFIMASKSTPVAAETSPSHPTSVLTSPSPSFPGSSKSVRFDIKNLNKSPAPMASIPEQSHPEYARGHDKIACFETPTWPIREFHYALTCIPPRGPPPKGKDQPKNMIFFSKTNSSIRHNIYHFMFSIRPNHKLVTLSKDFATKDVFPADYFITPWEILKDVKGALFASREMHDEIMTFFWQTYRFHVTFSPFTVGPTFSGLSIKWLNLYADRINHLTVEIDLTKLGYSAAKDAHLLKPALSKVDTAIIDLVRAIRRRGDKNNMSDLHLMLRRFDGLRPLPAGAAKGAVRVPYCPKSAFMIAWTFHRLRGFLFQIRMSGFEEDFFQKMAKMLFQKPLYGKADWPAWPDYTPTSATQYMNTPPSCLATATTNTFNNGSMIAATPGSKVSSHHRSGSSFATSWPDSSVVSSRPGSSLTNRDTGDKSTGLGISASLHASPSFRKQIEEESARQKGTLHPSILHAHIHQALRPEPTTSFDSSANVQESGAGSDDEPDAAKNPFALKPRQATGAQLSGSSQEAAMSPEKMNKLNEQDPAYERTLAAMNAARLELLAEEEAEKSQQTARALAKGSSKKKGGDKKRMGGKKR